MYAHLNYSGNIMTLSKIGQLVMLPPTQRFVVDQPVVFLNPRTSNADLLEPMAQEEP